MMYVDTHAVAWLYQGAKDLFPSAALVAMEAEDLVICPIVLLELQYLKEIKRITEDPRVIRERLEHSIGLRVRELSFLHVAEEAMLQTWTRDPFDRLMVAQAVIDNAPLLTKDRSIRQAYRGAFWSER